MYYETSDIEEEEKDWEFENLEGEVREIVPSPHQSLKKFY